MWTYNSVFYQIYPIGFCGAPVHNDGVTVPRIRKIMEWSDYLKDLGVDSILLNPSLIPTIMDMTQEIFKNRLPAWHKRRFFRCLQGFA